METRATKEARDRFFTAQSGRPATDQDKLVISVINEGVIDIGAYVIENVPAGRNQSLALTALEDFQMRAVRAIFAEGREL